MLKLSTTVQALWAGVVGVSPLPKVLVDRIICLTYKLNSIIKKGYLYMWFELLHTINPQKNYPR
jgi:hypothetical protein